MKKSYGGWYSMGDIGMMISRNYRLFGYLFGVRKDFGFEPEFANRGLPDDLSFNVSSKLVDRGFVEEKAKLKMKKSFDSWTDIEQTYGGFTPSEEKQELSLEKGEEVTVPYETYRALPRDSYEKLDDSFEIHELVDAHSFTYFYLDEMIEYLRGNMNQAMKPEEQLCVEVKDSRGKQGMYSRFFNRIIDDNGISSLSIDDQSEEELQRLIEEDKINFDRSNFFNSSELTPPIQYSIRYMNDGDLLGDDFKNLISLMRQVKQKRDTERVRAIIWFDN